MDDNGEADFDAAFYSMFNDEFNVVEEKLNELSFDESQHCTILEVERSAGRILLKLKSNKSRDVGVCSIEEFWSSSNNFKVGDSIYIKAVKTSDGSLFCKRKSVLSERFRGFEPGNRVMLIGVLIHTLLQNVLRHKLKTADEIETTLNNMLKSEDIIKKLYECDLTFSDIKPELQSFIPRILEFIDQYVNGGNSTNPEAKKNWKGKICGIDDIEENILCPELGIKGKIDVTVKTESNMMPLELKTGRATVSLEHRGQVMLYIMMMSKLGYKISSGLLLYLREGVLKEIKATPQEKRDIMILRNELAYYLTRNTIKSSSDVLMKPPELPEPINHHSACAKCSYNVICTSFLKFNNYDLSKNKALQEVQNDATAHLTEAHLSYFIHWVTLLSMEQGSSFDAKHLSDIYTVEPTKRELRGGCIINVKVVSAGVECNGLFEHVFKKDDFCESINLASYGITENNYVVISTANRPGVAAGFVTGISTSTVTIVLDRNLNEKYHGKLFHVDTYDTNITQSFNLTSVALLLENTPRAAQLRNTIIDKTAPTFASKLPSVVAKKGGPILRRLNHVQQKAVLKALCAKEFLLIKGMPGTGKTATIVALVQLLLELNKTVLITSHTHSAIDNICIRLQKYGIEFLRLGSESRIDKNLKSRSEASLTKGCTTPEQLQETYNSFKVIAVTCLGSNHPLLSKRSLDFCIVDESTQVLQTSVIRPLSVAKTFVLIGDPDQLAPVVKNRAAANAGMTETLFERLSVNADGIISLNLSYRMNKIITNLANVLTYKGQLQTANDHVANKTLAVPNIECVKSSYQDSPWLLKALDTSLEASVRFIDTGPVWQLPQNSGKFFKNYAFLDNLDTDNFINVHEIVIVATLVNALIKGGVTSSDIGVIATYRAQVAQISALLSEKNVDVSTVDQFQGRDKSVVIYSCTKSKDMSKTSSDTQKFELLQDQRRLTVAITRAKHKLLIVGDSSTLQHYATFSTILEALGKDNIIRFNSDWTILNEFIDLQ
ncbi:DNA replication ATP-dependent helicase/nuclease DNA2 [Asbolus verrucosus]|uniref:DNA replication ATP-dependent helicase/nuclease n=1 Tax=Asbolus verrucosus TaxID=1661398 RepID=A0A482VNU5_ASBVE|nr:DNA replication ATP-dependent helicase/nuclease DNA2 [Asbolus verrucosus]